MGMRIYAACVWNENNNNRRINTDFFMVSMITLI
jgi:hypothetical protein